MLQQPYPLSAGTTLDFSFDATELLDVGDTIASYVLTSSAITIVSSGVAAFYITILAKWTATLPVGSAGSVTCTITSTGGRVLIKTMTFMAVP